MIRTTLSSIITAAGIQTAVSLPANVRRLRIKSRSRTSFQMSFQMGVVELNQGIPVQPNEIKDTGWIHSSPSYLFLESKIPGNVIEIEIFTSPTLPLEFDNPEFEETQL